MPVYHKHKRTVLSLHLEVVDLFCGAGGLAYGLKAAGLKIVAGVDLDPAAQFPFEQNTKGKFLHQSVENVTVPQLEKLFSKGSSRVLAGCAPCQPFSTYSQSRKSPDERWKLLKHFQDLAVGLKPEFVTMENVSPLAGLSIWREFVDQLSDSGYEIDWAEVSASDYGVPQSRKRLVLVASRIGAIAVPTPSKKISRRTVRDTISKLKALSAGQADPDDPLHMASALSEKNLKRIQHSKPGATWRDWPEDLRAACHVRSSGETYPSVYGRMKWDDLAPTMTTQCYAYGSGRFGHPEQDRAISLREAALLQSFPKSYQFVPSGMTPKFRNVGILIGNAVPPKLGTAIGREIVKTASQAEITSSK